MQDGIVIYYVSIDDDADNGKLIVYLAKRFKTDAATIELFLKKPKPKMRVVATREEADKEVSRLKMRGINASYEGQYSIVGRKAQFSADEEEQSGEMMTCPRCQVYQVVADSCAICQVEFKKYGREKVDVSSVKAVYALQQAEQADDKPDLSFNLDEIRGLMAVGQVTLLLVAGYLLAEYVL